MTREFKYLDPKKIDENIEARQATGEVIDDDPHLSSEDVLVETLLDLCQLAEGEGMTEDEVDSAVKRVIDFRADRNRSRFRLHTGD